MKRDDLFFCVGVLLVVTPFFLFQELYRWYEEANRAHPYILAFFKFAILATAGESLGLRIQKGKYNEPGFGLLPRAVVWGVLGIWIAAAMKLYAVGAPRFVEGLGISGIVASMSAGLSWLKLLGAFSISVWMNTTFAPVFMTCHKVTDIHILKHRGSLKSVVTPICFGKILSGIDWQRQWSFIIKKTIPFFWIPAHTITFLLPPQWQVFFAAILGVSLGIILSIHSIKSNK